MSSNISKLFSAFGYGGNKLSLKSNVFGRTAGKYKVIGSTSSSTSNYGAEIKNDNSITTGTAITNRFLSTYYTKMSEIKSYELSDISEMMVSVFKDYVINFINKTGDIVTIKGADGEIDINKTERLNDILSKDLKIYDVIKDHLNEIIYYGGYHFMISQYKDDTGHTRLMRKDLLDPVSVVTKISNDKKVYIVRSDEDKIYELPESECIKIGSNDLRLIDDLSEQSNKLNKSIKERNNKSNRDKVVIDEYYSASKPMFYSITHKVKEYLLKDTIISLLSIKDLIQPLIMSLHFDKNTSLESANELTKKIENMVNKYTDLTSLLTAQFSVSDLMDSLLNNIRVIPDFNSSMSNMGTIELNKINQKIQEIRAELDTCRENILSTQGISLDLFSGRTTKWEALKTSERLNSKINSLINSIKTSISQACRVIYNLLYKEDIGLESIEVHMFSRTTTEYNSLINNAESIGQLTQQISTILEMSLRTLDLAGPLFDQKSYLEYISTMIKNIDPSVEKFMNPEQIQLYIQSRQDNSSSQDDQSDGW